MKYLVCAILFYVAALSCGAQTSLGLRKHLAYRKPNKKGLSVCGDDSWVAFEDTKCFKLISELATREEAYEKCSKESPSHDSLNAPLPVIKSKEEQEFLINYIFNRSLALDSFWLGGMRGSSGKFEWDDDSQTVYSNWADGSPSNSPDKPCMMLAHKNSIKQKRISQLDGLWKEVECGNQILVVCQKLQQWNRNEMQRAIINLRDEMKKSINEILTLREIAKRTGSLILNLDNEVKRTDKTLQTLESNPVPIGFIYVQLYGQPTPDTLWPGLGWSEVSSSYAGQFFRVVGGNAASFGRVQNGNAPRITHASSNSYSAEHNISLPVGGSSSHLYTGSHNFMAKSMGMAFSTSSGEVRPINQAVKLWKRTS